MSQAHVCPWWVGYLLASPLRKARNNPDGMLGPYVRPGMTVLDVGCAMGFFSLPLARMVGCEGRVVCVDLQDRMIRTLRRRAARAGLDTIVEGRVCTETSLNLSDLPGQVDVALAYAVLHEVRYPDRFLAEIRRSLRRDGLFLFGEPDAHVDPEDLDRELATIRAAGFEQTTARSEAVGFAVFRKGSGAVEARNA